MDVNEVELLQLYPTPSRQVAGGELYLHEDIGAGAGEAPFVYANFTSSLDGRIAVADEEGEYQVPGTLASPLDWRLFQQLQAHADCLVTHGGYLRALASGRHGDILQVGVRADNAPLSAWRAARGWRGQPAIVVLSATLDFTLPRSLAEAGQQVIVVTGRKADRARSTRLAAAGCQIIHTDAPGLVEGPALMDVLCNANFRRVYMQAGPDIVYSLFACGRLDRLYLTVSHCLLGGGELDALLRGTTGAGGGRLRLRSAYLDNRPARAGPEQIQHGPGSVEQSFLSYDCRQTAPSPAAEGSVSD